MNRAVPSNNLSLGRRLLWALNYVLKNYTVTYKGAQLRSEAIKPGVPQGSILGPILYLVYTSDLLRSDALSLVQFGNDLEILNRGT